MTPRQVELRRLIERLKVLRSNSRVPHAKATLGEAIVVVAAALARCEQEQGGDFPSEAFI